MQLPWQRASPAPTCRTSLVMVMMCRKTVQSFFLCRTYQHALCQCAYSHTTEDFIGKSRGQSLIMRSDKYWVSFSRQSKGTAVSEIQHLSRSDYRELFVGKVFPGPRPNHPLIFDTLALTSGPPYDPSASLPGASDKERLSVKRYAPVPNTNYVSHRTMLTEDPWAL